MTSFATKVQTCCLCGTENECQLVESTEANGSPDLDLRPGSPERESMHAWFQECQKCHYVSVDLARESEDAKSIVDSVEYRSLISNDEIPQIARRFAACAILNPHDREIAGTALLRAAWDCDDQEQSELAKSFRSQAADLLKKLQPFEDSEDQATIGVTLIDILRRAGRFEEATKLANQLLKFKTVKRSGVMKAVVNFQLSRCEASCLDCHKVEDAAK
jgi:hypothetical protein